MLILDSDHMSLLEWGGNESAVLRERLADHDADEVATTIEELLAAVNWQLAELLARNGAAVG